MNNLIKTYLVNNHSEIVFSCVLENLSIDFESYLNQVLSDFQAVNGSMNQFDVDMFTIEALDVFTSTL